MWYNKNMATRNKYLITTRFGSFYARISERKREGVFAVSIPAFPDVMTEARTLAEAKNLPQKLSNFNAAMFGFKWECALYEKTIYHKN